MQTLRLIRRDEARAKMAGMTLRGVSPHRKVAALALAGTLAALLASCAPAAVSPATVTVQADAEVSRQPAASPPPVPATQFTLVAAGDWLPHGPVVASATSGGVIDFSPLTANVKPFVEGADLSLCHMEVPVAPAGTAPSGYPMFGAPSELVRDLKEDGWDGCSTASNHSVDRKAAGIAATLEAFAAQGMGATGTARTATEAASIQFYVIHGPDKDVKVAHISYAYGLNGLPKPEGQPWAVNTFDAATPDASPIIEAAKQAREQGADVVITSVHCCVEYVTAPTPAQRAIAQQIADSGLVDLYIGHHAHVPQPIEKLNGGPGGKGMWTAFGLGNFISNQDSSCCAAESVNGVLLTSTFTVDDDDGVDVAVEWTGLTVDKASKHTLYAMASIAGGTATLPPATVQSRHDMVASAVGPQAPERTTPATQLASSIEMVPRQQ